MGLDQKLKVLYIGWHPEWYPRNWVIIQGLKRHGVDVRQMRVGPNRVTRFFNLLVALRKYKKQYGDKPDIITVAEVDLESFPFARSLARKWGCPVVFDAFYPRRDASVVCEKQTREGGLKDKALIWWEGNVLRTADLILSDTRQNAAFFHQFYNVPLEKFEVVYVGTDQELFKPGPEPPSEPFLVQFVGYYLRLHGANYIVRAADILKNEKDIRFEMIGYARRKPYYEVKDEVKRLKISNIVLRDEIPHSKLPADMQRASLCLGIFEDVGLAARVFPNKGYHALALAKPLLTMSSPALNEVLEPGKHAWAIPPADPRAIAEAIMYLKNNPEVRSKIARQGYDLFCEKYTPEKVTGTLHERLMKLAKDHRAK